MLSKRAKRLNVDVSLPAAAKPAEPLCAHMPSTRDGLGRDLASQEFDERQPCVFFIKSCVFTWIDFWAIIFLICLVSAATYCQCCRPLIIL